MYTSVEHIQDALGRELTTEEQSYFQNVLGPAITSYINQQTGTSFIAEGENGTDVAAYASGDGSTRLIIPTMYEITSVETDEGTTVPADTYREYPATAPYLALTKTDGEWADGIDNYTITGKMGYSSVPGDITGIATEIAINTFSNKMVDGAAVKSERQGSWSVTYETAKSGLSEMALGTLNVYKRLSTGV